MEKRLAYLILGGVLSAGCFTSTGPVWEGDQVFEDARIEGDYVNTSSDGKKDGTVWSIRPSGRARSYDVYVREEGAQIELEGTLFRLGSAAFLDLYPVRDSGMRAVGGTVSVTEVIHHFVYEPRHVIWKVEISDTNITYQFPSPKGAMAAAKKAPELKLKGKTQGSVIVLPESKTEAQKYIRQFATDPEVFDYKGTLVKKQGSP